MVLQSTRVSCYFVLFFSRTEKNMLSEADGVGVNLDFLFRRL